MGKVFEDKNASRKLESGVDGRSCVHFRDGHISTAMHSVDAIDQKR